MTNFDELIEDIEYYTREVANNTEWGMNTNEVKRLLVDARRALTDAISAVVVERDELRKITDVPEGQESVFYSCDKCGNYLPRVSALEHQLKTVKAALKEANEDAERFSSLCNCAGGHKARVIHNARLAKGTK